MNTVFRNRQGAGHELAKKLEHYRGTNTIVLGLARGGVEVGFSVSEQLGLPLKALVVQKIGAPGNPEVALGAVSETGALWLDEEAVQAWQVPASFLTQEISRRVQEVAERKSQYATGRDLASLRGKGVIVVDDGIATGSTVVAALCSVRGLGAARVILAAPVASRQAILTLQPFVDQMVVLDAPEPFLAIGFSYREFGQVTDDAVIRYLEQAKGVQAREPEIAQIAR